MLVGFPGTGKTLSITTGREFLAALPDFNIAPDSVTGPSLLDALAEVGAKADSKIGSASLALLNDDWQVLMDKTDTTLIAVLTKIYDPTEFRHTRRGNKGSGGHGIDIRFDSPQLNIIGGTTPYDLHRITPESAWNGGFMSRMIIVYSTKPQEPSNPLDNVTKIELPPEMIHDLIVIRSSQGGFVWTEGFNRLQNEWNQGGQEPKPSHPKLEHYCSRRLATLYKLSMIAAIDRGEDLILTEADFHRAMGWLTEVEKNMPAVFSAGRSTSDSRTMDDFLDWVKHQPQPIPEYLFVRMMGKFFNAYQIKPILQGMVDSRQILPDTEGKGFWIE